MALDTVRQAIMDSMGDIDGVTVPDPVPAQLDDKSVIVYPRPGNTTAVMHRGSSGGIVVEARDAFIVEYHRRIPAEHFGSVLGDVTAMVQTIRDAIWGEFTPSGGHFGGTVSILHGVGTDHLGTLGWNEWTFGCRLTIDLSHYSEIS